MVRLKGKVSRVTVVECEDVRRCDVGDDCTICPSLRV